MNMIKKEQVSSNTQVKKRMAKFLASVLALEFVEDLCCDAAIGSMVGMAVCDSVGLQH